MGTKTIPLWLLVFSATFLSACGAPGSLSGTPEKFTLGNGVTVLLQPLHSVPVVAMHVWVHVGSKDENDATRGLAHIHEHMLFQGTASYPPGAIFRAIESVGGDFNAYTNQDTTVFHVTMPREGLETGLRILASMMQEATIDETLLRKELQDRKSTRLNSSHNVPSRMPSSA